MHQLALVACLACAVQGRRMQTVLQQSQHQPHAESPQSSKALEMILTADNGAAAFNAVGPGLRFPAKSRCENCVPVMGLGDDLKRGLGNLRASTSAAAAALALLLTFNPVQTDIPYLPMVQIARADDKPVASAGSSQVNKDPTSLLRLALPNQPKEMAVLSDNLQGLRSNIKLGSVLTEIANVKAIKGGLEKKPVATILKAVPAGKTAEAEALIASISSNMDAVVPSADTKVSDFNSEKTTLALADLGKLEELIAQKVPRPVPPAEYTKTIPYLKGRATIDVTLKPSAEHAQFNIRGTKYDKVDVSMVVDGYTAPLTAGNFVDLVNRGYYNNFPIQRSDGFVVQTGDPSAEGAPAAFKSTKTGFTPPGAKKVRRLPLELFVKGEKEPLYEATFDDDGKAGFASQLPFNAYGALGMAREEDNYNTASTQFFWLLFDSDLTPAGKNLLDGRYTCFGMTTTNENLLADVQVGDIITSAKVTSGLENLVSPPEPAAAA